ncbi:MAG TPA: ParB/RepB/Spo0J family partition protein [Gemmatimonadales bacterium]|nr:ParB/RepB/Spo0J family partition protein [Gemmatimonadales bacterium]
MSPEGRRRLGRGLEALLGAETVEEAEREGTLRELPVGDIRPNRYQPRRAFDPGALKELKDSIASNGLIQPVIVRQVDGGYELVAGERRWRAVKELGWARIPAVVREVDERTLLTLALIENLQRAALSPIDEAQGYERLVREFSLSQLEVAEAVGRDRSTVANAIRLLQLPRAVQDLLHSGALSAGHARALLSLADEREIVRLAREAVAHDWSVRETEQRTRGSGATARTPRGKRGRRSVPPEARRIEESLRRKLGTDVAVVLTGKQRGHLSIRFYSHDDLARLLELILGKRWDG